MNDREIHGESNVWSTAQIEKMKDFMFGLNELLVGYGKQYLLVWSCVEEREKSHLEEGNGF